MHQPVDTEEEQEPLSEEQRLKKYSSQLMAQYKQATNNACRAWDYFQRFRRSEDWDEDTIQEYLNVLKLDSKRYIRESAIHIRRLRNAMDRVNQRLVDIAAEKQREKKE